MKMVKTFKNIMLSGVWLFLIFVSPSIQDDYSDYPGSGNGSSGGSDDLYNYEYESGDEFESSSEYYDSYGEDDVRPSWYGLEDTVLEYLPEITSKPQEFDIIPEESVEFPCKADEADKFVRVWLKDGVMLFTGSIRLNDDNRFELSDDNTSLILNSAQPEDSGTYECRIMVKESLSVKHKLIVTKGIKIVPDPKSGVATVLANQQADFGCHMNREDTSLNITWSRDNNKFRNGEYTWIGSRMQIDNVTSADGGYYYCKVKDKENNILAASVLLQVNFSPEIVSLTKSTVDSGHGLNLLISCSVIGDPKPKIIWYKDGECIDEKDTRLILETAGTRNVLTVQNVQNTDVGSYMCYARNQVGSTQKTLLVLEADRVNEVLKVDKQLSSESTVSNMDTTKILENLKLVLNQEREKSESTLEIFRSEIENIRELFDEFRENQNISQLTVYSQGPSNSFNKAVLSDIDRVDSLIRGLTKNNQQHFIDWDTFTHKSQDDRQRLWDTVFELQEITNITNRNIEEIYDKDVLNLHHLQSTLESEVQRLRMQIPSGGYRQSSSNDQESESYGNDIQDMERSFQSMTEEVNYVRNQMILMTESVQNVRNDVNQVFSDIDSLKKQTQQNYVNVEHLKRNMSRLEVENINENKNKIENMQSLLEGLEIDMDNTEKKIRKASQRGEERDKIKILVIEVQKLKTQIYYLQQSFMQLRTQEQLNQSATSGVIVPITNGHSPEVDRLKTDVEVLMARLSSLEGKECVTKSELKRTVQDRVSTELTSRLAEEEDYRMEEMEMWLDRIETLEKEGRVANDKLSKTTDSLLKMKEELEVLEKEQKKYFLVFRGLRKSRRQETQRELKNAAMNFIKKGLKLENIMLESAERISQGNARSGNSRALPIRVRFFDLRDRNSVLTASRGRKTRVLVTEDFTERTMTSRQKLVEYAKKNSTGNRSKWALQGDKLYMNKKIYVYVETRDEIISIADIS